MRSHWARYCLSAASVVVLECSRLMAADFPIVAVNPPMNGVASAAFSASDPNDFVSPLRTHSILPAFSMSPNESAVHTALENIRPAATGGLLSMINTLGTETPHAQQLSLTQLSGELFGNTQTIGLQVGDQFQQRLITRLVSNSQFLTGLSPQQVPSQAQSSGDVRGQSPVDSYSGWAQGFGVGGTLSTDGNGADLNYSQGGLISGLDLASDDSGVFGISIANSYVGYNGFAGGGQMAANQIGFYGLKHNDVAYVQGSANYGYESFRTDRNYLVGSTNQTAFGRFGAHQLGTYVETGLKFDTGLLHFQPLVGLQYLYLSQQGFDESGGSGAMSVSASQASSLRTNIGGRIVVDQFKGPRGSTWTPYWHGRWVSELLDNDRTVNASFIGAPIGGAFTTHGNRLGTNYGILGKGFQIQWNDQWSVFGNYDTMFGGRIETFAGSAGIVYVW